MAKSLIYLLMAGVCFGQSGSVSGLVTDPSGAPVEGVAVRAVRIETQAVARTVTNASGLYAFPALTPGRYVLSVEKEGFRTAERRELVVTVAGRLSENFALVIGERTDSLTVEDRAPVIERLSPAVQTLFDREMVQNLPLNGRSFQSLIELAPGVVLTPTSFASPGQFSVNGQRANANYFMIDGVSANVGVSASATAFPQSSGSLPGQTMMGGTNGLVSIDALQEFRVLTSSFAPEFGRMPGGQVLIQTRSGSNRYTGSLYNYFRNEKLDANDWLANSEGVERRALRQNLFGGVLGGPVWAPGLYQGRDRTFFFVSYEGQRLTQPQAALVNALVPSTAARQ
ncbi:MAG TPA: TonB-dependent receptor, partial [Solibacterales bacterium]|nr:TonB-dependent receptor [Bryobacterales bacterium]